MSCLPSTWSDTGKRKGSEAHESVAKRPKSNFEDACPSHRDIVSSLLCTLRRQAHAADPCSVEDESDLVVEACAMLSAVPFGQMLQQVPGGEPAVEVPVVTRAYEEQYMRGQMTRNEPLCEMGAECECMLLDSKIKFVGIQFEIPYTTSALGNKLCVFCLRKMTQLLFYETVERGLPVKQVLQKYGNIRGEPREYHPSAMLVAQPRGPVHCLPLPIVAHQRNKLVVELVGGVPHVRQKGVSTEDF